MRRAVSAAAVFIFCATWSGGAPRAAEFPRRIAIAPFTAQSQDNIAPVVSILPRLLSVRLTAISGADVVLLSPGTGSPAEAAREAKVPLLLQGTVSKLGKGYSIDTTAVDLETGKTAGAFYAAPATEDEIIVQLGQLAADIAERLFGVRTSPRLPAGQAQAPAASHAPVSEPAVAQEPPPGKPAAAGPAASPIPAGFRKVSQSDKIPEEIYGVVTADAGPDGAATVVAYGRRTLYFYRAKGKELLPYTRIQRSPEHHFLNVEAADIDGDGSKEILVTDYVADRFQSFVLKRKGDGYEEAAGEIRYYLVVLPDWLGKPVVVGQRGGLDTVFVGKLVAMKWEGGTLKEAAPLPANVNILPLSGGIPGLSSAPFGSEWRLVYTDEMEHLRVVTPEGKSEYKSKRKYGVAADFLEYGPLLPLEGRRARIPLRKAPRYFAAQDGMPLILITFSERGLIARATADYESRVALLRWTGSEFAEAASAPKTEHFHTGADVVQPPGAGGKGTVVTSVIEQFDAAFAGATSRLVLFAGE